MFDYLRKRPMIFCAISIAVTAFFAYYSKALLFLIGMTCAIFMTFCIIKKSKYSVLIILIFTQISVISISCTVNKAEKLSKYNSFEIHGEFIVCEEAFYGNGYCRTVVKASENNIFPKNTKLAVFYNQNYLELGDIITADVKISSLEEDTYRKFNFSNGIYLSGNLKNIKTTGRQDFILSAVGEVRNYIKTSLFSFLSYDEAATLCGLISGDDSYFTETFSQNIKHSGVSHIMVVSGMHMAVVISFITGVLEHFFNNKYLEFIVIALSALFIMFLCGFTMSITRAGSTYLLIAFSILTNRKNNAVNTLAVAVCIILIASPFAIFSLSFQLSVLSTFGILVIALPITEYVKQNRIIKSKIMIDLFSIIIISLSANILTLPVVIYNFGYIAVYSLVTNLFVSFAATFAINGTIIGLVINLFLYEFSRPFFFLAGICAKYIKCIIDTVANLPFSVVYVPKQTAILPIIMIILIFEWLVTCKKSCDMLKSKMMIDKIISEGGRRIKWR